MRTFIYMQLVFFYFSDSISPFLMLQIALQDTMSHWLCSHDTFCIKYILFKFLQWLPCTQFWAAVKIVNSNSIHKHIKTKIEMAMLWDGESCNNTRQSNSGMGLYTVISYNYSLMYCAQRFSVVQI